MMTSSNISAHNLLDPLLTGHSTIQLVSPTDDDLRDGGHFCHDWVSHYHHHQQAGSDDRLKHDEMDIENGIGAWVWEKKNEHHGTTTGDDFDSDDHTQENWVPSKLKVVKKMNPKRASTGNSVPVIDNNTDDFPYSNDSISNGSSNNGIRVCSDCNTTKTPLWRSGPKGPKSLCNACGIRQRKARRALAAASTAAGSDNAVTKPTTSPKSLKVKLSNTITMEKKPSTTKRLKLAESSSTSTAQDAYDQCNNNGRKSSREICFEEFMKINLSKNSGLQRVFPQDEKEAAILLMALSCGLVHHHN